MRKAIGLLFAFSLCAPIGVLTAGPAGAVNRSDMRKLRYRSMLLME